MADFTGMTVKVTLKEPQDTILHGQVTSVVAGQTLALQNVVFPTTGARFLHYTVPGPAIADLQVIATDSVPVAPPPSIPHGQAASSQPIQQIKHSQPGFVDPAILSYGKSPVQQKQPQRLPHALEIPIKPITARPAPNLPSQSSQLTGEGRSSETSRAGKAKQVKDIKDTVDRQHAEVHLQQKEQDGAQDDFQNDTKSKRKTSKDKRKKLPPVATHDPPPIMNVDVSRNGNDMDASVKRGKGWRQTPLLQSSLQPPSVPTPKSTKKSRRQRDEAQERQQNGWATEDATDIQDMGEFDFEANHKLFDKKQVFDQLRQGDTTADEDRLVSHNRLHRPGTYGGKNLHPTENVLSPQLGPKSPNNELDSSSDADTELNLANGRSSSRHSAARNPMRKQASRQGSAHVDGKAYSLITSAAPERTLSFTRSIASLSGTGGRTTSNATPSPRPELTRSPTSTAPGRTHDTDLHARESHFVVSSSMEPCPVLFPAALDTLENETVSRYGLTQEAITENAARCIAEMAVGMFDATETRRVGRGMRSSVTTLSNPDENKHPVVVIMAGNHAIGARAVAAARHLVCRDVQIIVAEAAYESPETLDTQAKTQTAMLKRLMKSGAAIKRGSWRKASNYIKNLTGPPALIIDALLAGVHYAQPGAEAREMIDWANRSRAAVLSLACPSGISGADGTAPVVEGEPLAVRADAVLCLGAPMRGLLLAMKKGERWRDLRLADIGINVTLRRAEAVPFGVAWVVPLAYMDEESATTTV